MSRLPPVIKCCTDLLDEITDSALESSRLGRNGVDAPVGLQNRG
jgi:hypothetical protein